MASKELRSIPGYHNVNSAEARELLQPYFQMDGYYLLRPSSDNKGYCTICVTNQSKPINYRLSRKEDTGTYSVFSHDTPFSTISELLTHYKTTPINSEMNTCLLYPVLSGPSNQPAKSEDTPVGQREQNEKIEQGKEVPPVQQMQKSETQRMTKIQQQQPQSPLLAKLHRNTDASGSESTYVNNIPGLHLYLPKTEIDAVMSSYLNSDGNYLLRPSSSSPDKFVLTVSHGGKILNYKIVDNGGLEFYITPRRKFPNIHTLLETYKTTPIKSKKGATLLLHPIPVDVSVEQKHRQRLELRAANKVPASPPSPAQDALPSPWQRHMHQQYRKYYYYNPHTNESTWERPKAVKTKPPPTSPKAPPTSPKPSPLIIRKMRDRSDSAERTTPTATPSADSAPPPLPERTDLKRAGAKSAAETTPTEDTSPPVLPPKPQSSKSHAPKHAATPPVAKKPLSPLTTTVSSRESEEDGWCVVANRAQESPRGATDRQTSSEQTFSTAEAEKQTTLTDKQTPERPPKPANLATPTPARQKATPPSVRQNATPPPVAPKATHTPERHNAKPPPVAPKATPPLVRQKSPLVRQKKVDADEPVPSPSTTKKVPPPLPIRSSSIPPSPSVSPPPSPALSAPPPPPPPPLLPPPLSPALLRPRASSLRLENASSGQPSANDLQVAHKQLRKRANSSCVEGQKDTASGIAGAFSDAIDTRMMHIRRAMVVSTDSESDCEDVDGDW